MKTKRGSTNSLETGSRSRTTNLLEEVLPPDTFQERFSGISLNNPERERDSDPVQPSASDLGEILFGLRHTGIRNQPARDGGEKIALVRRPAHNESLVMVLNGGGHVGAEVLAKRPLVDSGRSRGLERFVEGRTDERF